MSPINLSHPSRADLLGNAVMAQRLADKHGLANCLERHGEIPPSPCPLSQIVGPAATLVNVNHQIISLNLV